MRITRDRLVEIIEEEVRGRYADLRESSVEEDEPKRAKKKAPSKPEVSSADAEPSPKQADVPDGGTVKAPDGSPIPPGGPGNQGPDTTDLNGEQPDPSAEPEEEPEEPDTEEPNPDEPSGAINDEVSGKTVQAVTIDPKSKVLPGAKEVVLAFNESTDALRILVTPTGMVKFFWRGQLHDLP